MHIITKIENHSIEELEKMQSRAIRELLLHLMMAKKYTSQEVIRAVSILRQIDNELEIRRGRD